MEVFTDNYSDWVNLAKSYVGEFYAKDIVNEAYIRLHDKKELNRSYIFLTIRSICIDYLREKNKIYKVDIKDGEAQTYKDTKKEIALQKIKDKIEKEIDTWHWYDAKLFRLYKDSDKSLRCIANETQISLVSIFHTIKTCKSIIKNKFGKDYENYYNENYDLI